MTDEFEDKAREAARKDVTNREKARGLVCICADHPACVERITKALDEASRQGEERWIPVSERPGGPVRQILVRVRDGRLHYFDVWSSDNPNIAQLVTHWRELPDFPALEPETSR